MIITEAQIASDKHLHEYLVKNKDRIIAMKRAEKKLADCASGFLLSGVTDVTVKAVSAIENPPNILPVRVVINTTNLYDSHGDVHIPGLWGKSLKEYKYIQHLREHRNSLDAVISDGDSLKAYTVDTTFKALGYSYDGTTQALVFDSNVDKERNPFMHNYYAKGWVNQHSVGMQYVKLITCIDNKEYKEEFAAYAKYIDHVANREDIKRGYFYAVTEAKALEGSAVTRGSNHVTPTLANNLEQGKTHSFVNTEPLTSSTRKMMLF